MKSKRVLTRFFVSFICRGMMSVDQKTMDDIRAMLDPLTLEKGFELVDIEFRREPRGKILRVYIDKEGGVNIGDCTRISQELGVLLDVHDVISGPYTLEVSSPGLDRPLRKPKDFERFKGRKVKIKTRSDIDKRRVFVGRLVDYADSVATVEADGREYAIPYEDIDRANLELDF